MLYKVRDLSNLLNVSQVTIYKKIKLKEIEPHVIKNKGVTFVTEEGFNLIKDNLSFKVFNEEVNNNECIENDSDCHKDIDNRWFKGDLTGLNKLIEAYENEIDRLWVQLNEKDRQISELHKLIENNQVLLKDKREDPILLEQHFKEFDARLQEVKDKLDNRKRFFSKFKR